MIDFVGAGPGAADLITLRGKELIEGADIIIYAGSLVNPELLGYAGENCRIYNSASMTLEEVLGVMKEGHRNGKRVVRLHTGDPSIYGAIKEQMDALDREEIEYRVCPGVSSLFAAAAALKAEYTLPGVSQSLIVTRMEGRTAVPEKESIEAFAAHGSSMVVFLSAGMLEELTKRLIKGGYREDTPAAIVYRASWEDERVIRTRVSELYAKAVENNISRQALIVVGDFLGSDYELSRLYDPAFSHGYRRAEK